MFKLKAHNVLFWLIAPTLATQKYFDCHIHERIDQMWKTHMHRVDKGLDGTYKAHGIYNDKMQDNSQQINNGVHLRLDSIIHGVVEKPYLDNPFQRFHESIEEYPEFHDDIDDVNFIHYDNWERLKPFDPKDGSTVGETPAIPTEDNDQKLYFYDVQGESVYTNPPDTNLPVIDHGLDELKIWAFNLTGYNQEVVRNPYTQNIWSATKAVHAPFWGNKLFTPAFYREEKLAPFMRQWSHRLNLEVIKMRHAISNRAGDTNQRKQMKAEIEAYIQKAYREEQEALLQDVYVTDHSPRQAKYHTTNKKDDEQFYNYKQSLAEYNSTPAAPVVEVKNERYPRGSLLQRAFDPLAGSERLENGAIFYRVADSEVELPNEEKLRAEWERAKNSNSGVLEASEDDINELRIALMDEMQENSPFNEDEFSDILDKEFSIFKNGEKYDFVKDIKDAFSQSLEKPSSEKILDTIPDHAFWDIKTPQKADPQRFMNPYNSFRKYHTSSFFDAREYEEYMDRRTKKNNLRDSISTHRRY